MDKNHIDNNNIDKNSENNETSNSTEDILNKINELIESHNTINNMDKINEIIKLIISDMNFVDRLDDNIGNIIPSISQQLFQDKDIQKTNQQNIDANESTVNITNTNQPTVNINQPSTAQSSSETASQTPTTTEPTLTQTLQSIIYRITQVNTLKEELCQLPLNPCEKDYINNNIIPMLDVLVRLSGVGLNFSVSINNLTTSPIVPRKKSKLKEVINATYSLNEQSVRLYKIVKKRINDLLECSD